MSTQDGFLLVMGHCIYGRVYDFPHLCPGENCAIGLWLLRVNYRSHFAPWEQKEA